MPPKQKTKQTDWWKIEKGKKKWVLNQAQQDVINSKARYRAMICGTGAGKTVAGSVFLYNQIVADPSGSFLVVSPTVKIQNQSVLPTWKRTIANTPLATPPKDLDFGWRVTEREWRLPTGGTIYFRSASDVDDVHGVHCSGAWIDEAGRLPLAVLNAVESRVGNYDAPIFLSSTPYTSFYWLKTEILDRFNSGDENYYVRTGSSLENSFYSKAFFEHMRATKSERYFRMQYLGEWDGGAMGLVYEDLNTCFVKMPSTGVPLGKFYGAIDYGGKTRDPFASLVAVLDEDDCLWVFFERYTNKFDNHENINYLNDWHETFKKHTGHSVKRWIADSNQSSFNSAIRRKSSLNVRNGCNQPGDVGRGIELVLSRIRLGKLKIIESACPGLLAESTRYTYKVDPDSGEVVSNKPVDKHNHSMDCLRQLCLWIDRKNGGLLDLTTKYDEDENE
jgi:PBSX family phage terminase large subunit